MRTRHADKSQACRKITKYKKCIEHKEKNDRPKKAMCWLGSTRQSGSASRLKLAACLQMRMRMTVIDGVSDIAAETIAASRGGVLS